MTEIPYRVSQLIESLRATGQADAADEIAAAYDEPTPAEEADAIATVIEAQTAHDVAVIEAQADASAAIEEVAADARIEAAEIEAAAAVEVAETIAAGIEAATEAAAEAAAEESEEESETISIEIDNDDDAGEEIEAQGAAPRDLHWYTRPLFRKDNDR